MQIKDIPKIGLGTFGSDSVKSEQIAQAVDFAVRSGYRHIDCAAVYGNEKEIGETLIQLFAQKIVKREDVWITSKLWNDKHDDVLVACKQSLNDLKLEYLDLYLVHWPFPNFHPPKCDVMSRSKESKPYIHENFMKTWHKMEELVSLGLVKNIGTSNMTIPKLKLVLRDATIKPACNELELHPHFQQQQLLSFLKENDIQPIAYSPLGSPGRPERDKTAADTCDMEDPLIIELAKKYSVHPAAICLKWVSASGAIPIPFSANPKNLAANLAAISQNPLTTDELSALAKIDKNCRLIKGQVFLWKDNQNWEDLWDLNGVITK